MKISLPKQEYAEIHVGENQLFKVTKVVYNEETHTLRISYRDKYGAYNSEFFRLETRETEDAPYTPNPQGLKMFAIFYRGVTGEKNAEDADPEELVDKYFMADVKEGAEKRDGNGYWMNVWSKRPTDLTFDDIPDKPKEESEEVDEW